MQNWLVIVHRIKSSRCECVGQDWRRSRQYVFVSIEVNTIEGSDGNIAVSKEVVRGGWGRVHLGGTIGNRRGEEHRKRKLTGLFYITMGGQ